MNGNDTLGVEAFDQLDPDAIAQLVDQVLNGAPHLGACRTRQIGFVLLLFPVDTDPRMSTPMQYISNAQRDDVRRLLRAQLEHFEALSRKETP